MKAPDAIELRARPPAVVLETAFLVGGLPEDRRRPAVERIASAVTSKEVEPAFAGLIDGRPIVGLEPDELDRLAREGTKLGVRELGPAVARGLTGGTTVAATLFLGRRSGLAVMATGGIGGVHPSPGPPDVSADLTELSRSPMILVCSGTKAFLDAGATLERLETLGVTVIGLGTDRFPGFWATDSGLPLPLVAEGPDELVEIWQASRRIGLPAALLVCAPPPDEAALDRGESERAVSRALHDLDAEGITGSGVTPFLLERIATYTDGRSVEANLALLARNAAVAATLARALD